MRGLQGKHGKDGKEDAGGARKEAAKADEEAAALPEVKQLPPWFKETPDAKDVRASPCPTPSPDLYSIHMDACVHLLMQLWNFISYDCQDNCPLSFCSTSA